MDKREILHTADVHLGKPTHGRFEGGRSSRLDDFAKTFDAFADDAIERDVDAAVIAGDLFDSRRPGPEELMAAAGPLSKLSRAKIPTLIVPGNHDGAGTVHDPASHTLTWMAELAIPYVYVRTTPLRTELSTKRGVLEVLSLPFPHKRAVTSDDEMAERTERVSQDVEAVIRHMISGLSRQVPSLFIGHLTVVGGLASPGQFMRPGWDVAVSVEAFAGVDYAALGHLHTQHSLAENVWYAGSPDVHDFGEDPEKKGWLHVEVRRGASPVVMPVLSNPRPFPIVQVDELPDGTWADLSAWIEGNPDGVRNGTVLLRLRPFSKPKAPLSVLASFRQQLYDAGAFLVKDETITPESQRRARVEIDPEVEVEVAVEQWARAKGVDPDRVMPVAKELLASFRHE